MRVRSTMLNQSGHFAEPFPTAFTFERFITGVSLKMSHQFLSLAEYLSSIVHVTRIILHIGSRDVSLRTLLLLLVGLCRFRVRDAVATFPKTSIL